MEVLRPESRFKVESIRRKVEPILSLQLELVGLELLENALTSVRDEF